MNDRIEFLDKISVENPLVIDWLMLTYKVFNNSTQLFNNVATLPENQAILTENKAAYSENKSNLYDNLQLDFDENDDSSTNSNTNNNTIVKAPSCKSDVEDNSNTEIVHWKKDQIDRYTEFAYSLIKEYQVIDKQKFMEKFGNRFKNEFSTSDMQKVNIKSSLFKWEEKIHNNIYNRLILTGKIVFKKPNYLSSDFIMQNAKNIKTIVSTENTMQE
jgi:hypothetical protein